MEAVIGIEFNTSLGFEGFSEAVFYNFLFSQKRVRNRNSLKFLVSWYKYIIQLEFKKGFTTMNSNRLFEHTHNQLSSFTGTAEAKAFNGKIRRWCFKKLIHISLAKIQKRKRSGGADGRMRSIPKVSARKIQRGGAGSSIILMSLGVRSNAYCIQLRAMFGYLF